MLYIFGFLKIDGVVKSPISRIALYIELFI